MWACGVAAAAKAAATDPGLRLFVLGALGGVAGSWEALFFSKMVLCRNSLGTGTCGTGPRLAKSAPSCRVEQERGQPPAHRSHGHRSHASLTLWYYLLTSLLTALLLLRLPRQLPYLAREFILV